MKALVYRGPREIRYESVPDPVLPDERGALVRVTRAAICGSDLHIYDGHGFSPNTGYVIGHEAIGEVVEVGSAVRGFATGDRVLVPASVGCGRCPACQRGEVSCCIRLFQEGGCYGLGMPHLGGGQAELLAVPAADHNLVAIPEGVSDDAALVLTDNGPTGWYGARLGRVTPGDTVVVIGLGAVGLMAAEAALVMGAAHVLGLDLVEERRARGATLGVKPLEGEPGPEVLARTDGRGADVVIEAVGSDATINLALSLARAGGHIGIVGVNQSLAFPFPMFLAQARCLEFGIGVCSVQRELPTVVPLVLGGRFHPEATITHHLALSAGPEAYAMFAERSAGVGKVVLDVA